MSIVDFLAKLVYENTGRFFEEFLGKEQCQGLDFDVISNTVDLEKLNDFLATHASIFVIIPDKIDKNFCSIYPIFQFIDNTWQNEHMTIMNNKYWKFFLNEYTAFACKKLTTLPELPKSLEKLYCNYEA